MNKKYLEWIRHEFYLWKQDIENNTEPAIFYTTLSYLKWLRTYYQKEVLGEGDGYEFTNFDKQH